MKIIFLDIDGVLNHLGTAQSKSGLYPIDETCVKFLNKITDQTGAKLVISSTWRIGKTLDWLKETLCSKGVTGEIIDKTVSLYNEERGVEIQEWLDKTDLVIEKFIILDDDSDFGKLLPHLIQTHFYNQGLTEEIANLAIQRLQ